VDGQPAQLQRALDAFLAARRSHDAGARPGKPSTWAEPMARLLEQHGAEQVLGLASWLFGTYGPERPDFDWRSRCFTPYHLERQWDALVATRTGQQQGGGPAAAAACPCGSTTTPDVDLDEDRLECLHHVVLARSRTVRCANCQQLLDQTFLKVDACDSCNPDGQDAHLHAWATQAAAHARSLHQQNQGGTA
jgi:hypothetical protein